MFVSAIKTIFPKTEIKQSYNPRVQFAFLNNGETDSVSFSGGTGMDGRRMRKSLAGMNCPCCGLKMLTPGDVRSAMVYPPDEPSKHVIPKIKKFEESLHETERACFQLLERLSQEDPWANLRELLDSVRDEHLRYLHRDEKKIIDRIRAVGSFLSDSSKAKLDKTLREAETLIRNNDYQSTFKRRAFIGKIGDAVSSLPEKDIADTIFEIAHEMPRAGTNPSAFVVKYSEKNPANNMERDAHDIIQGLLAPSVGTIEHVKVRSPLIENGGGENSLKNYIFECAHDNNNRNCMPFWSFVKQNPQLYGQHAQKYIDAIIERLNRGELKGFERYPLLISRTLRRQSKGKIKLDISKLNLPQSQSEPAPEVKKKGKKK